MDTYITIFWSHLPCFPLQVDIHVIVNKLVDAEEQNCVFFCGAGWFWNPEVTAVEGQAPLSCREVHPYSVWVEVHFWDVSPSCPHLLGFGWHHAVVLECMNWILSDDTKLKDKLWHSAHGASLEIIWNKISKPKICVLSMSKPLHQQFYSTERSTLLANVDLAKR